MTEPTLLDESAISKIEARIAKRDDTTALESACGEYNCSCHYDLPALCATVKHLRALAYVPKILPADDEVAYRDQAERLLREKVELQSQLEQLRAENEALRTAVANSEKYQAGLLK